MGIDDIAAESCPHSKQLLE